MKKLLSMLAAVAVVLTLAGCGSKEQTPVEPNPEVEPEKPQVENNMSAIEVAESIMTNDKLASGMENAFFDKMEMDLDAVLNAINFNQFSPDKKQLSELPGFKSGAQIMPMMGTNAIIIIEFENGTEGLDEIATMLEDYKSHMICMTADIYDTFVVDNYVFFVSAMNFTEDGEADESFQPLVVETIKGMSFVK